MNDDVRFFLGVYQIYALLGGRAACHARDNATALRGNERTNEVSRLGTRASGEERRDTTAAPFHVPTLLMRRDIYNSRLRPSGEATLSEIRERLTRRALS